MIKYIIYEDDEEITKKYTKIINSYMINKNINYRIIVFNKFDSEIHNIIKNNNDEKIVYLLDIEVSELSGIDLAREIRKNGDWKSQIIMLTAHEEKNYFLLTNRLLTLAFIYKNNLENELVLALDDILKICFNDNILTFRYNSEIFSVFYNDIYYIEKNIHNNSSTVYTKDKKYTIRSSINNLMKIFKSDSRFFKTHRSCIINLDNVCEYNIDFNVIKFKKGEINLVSRNKKKEFIKLLLDKSNIN